MLSNKEEKQQWIHVILNRAELVDFTTNAATGVANGKVLVFWLPRTPHLGRADGCERHFGCCNLNAVEARAASMEATQLAQDAAGRSSEATSGPEIWYEER